MSESSVRRTAALRERHQPASRGVSTNRHNFVTEKTESASFWKLIRTRNFGLLWGAGGLSAIGDQFDLIAFPWLVVLITGDPLAVGLVIAVGNVPTIFFMLLGGSLVDRFSPRMIMLTSNVIRIALSAALAALVLTGLTDLWLIYAFALLKGIADSFYYPAASAMLPRIVPIRLLRQSNAVVHTTAELSGFFGPALAGALIALFSGGASPETGAGMTGIGLAFAVVAFAFLISSILLLLVRIDGIEPEQSGEDGKERGILSSIVQGIRFVHADGAMFTMFLLVASVELLIEGPVIVGIPILADTRMAEGALALGIITSAYAGGSLMGAILAGTLPAPKRGLGPTLVTIVALSGILMMPFGFMRAMWAAAGFALAIGVMGGYVDILFTSWLQGRTPRAMMGRVMSLLMVAAVGLSPISVAASGALIKQSLEWVFVVAGSLVAISCIVAGLRREVRAMRMMVS